MNSADLKSTIGETVCILFKNKERKFLSKGKLKWFEDRLESLLNAPCPPATPCPVTGPINDAPAPESYLWPWGDGYVMPGETPRYTVGDGTFVRAKRRQEYRPRFSPGSIIQLAAAMAALPIRDREK